MALSKKKKIDLRTYSEDAVPAALQGSIYWHDTGTTENGEAVYANADKSFAHWNDGTNWLITVFSDVGGTPTDFFVLKDYPSEITISGVGAANGTYSYDGIIRTKASWTLGVYDLTWDAVIVGVPDDSWTIYNTDTSQTFGYITEDTEAPSKTGWASTGLGAATLSYELNRYEGAGAFSGTLTLSEYTIADAWFRAEEEAFESLREFLGYTENKDCFRGFLPVKGEQGVFEKHDVWMMTSGGSSFYDMDRLAADDTLWCTLRVDAQIESVWEHRSDAMKFAGAVLAWLKENENLRSTGNLEQCRLTGIPDDPQLERIGNRQRRRFWTQTIELELIYKTESVFS